MTSPLVPRGQSVPAVRVGRSIDWYAEGNLDPVAERVVALMDLHNALYGVEQQFQYDDTDEARQLVEQVRGLMMDLDRLSLTAGAELTLNRECSRCSGDGKTKGEDPCVECGGQGHAHADEADG